MRLSRLLLLIALCVPLTASSQTIDCLPPATRLRMADSLRALPKVREEAAAWRESAESFQASATKWRAADSLHLAGLRSSMRASAGQSVLLTNQAALTTMWTQRARRRGLVNVLLEVVLAGTIYVFITH
jgi:hypothetical protein